MHDRVNKDKDNKRNKYIYDQYVYSRKRAYNMTASQAIAKKERKN